MRFPADVRAHGERKPVRFRAGSSGEESSPRNRLLRALETPDLERLRSRLTLVPLRSKQILHLSRTPMEDVYFIESGLVSVSTSPERGKSVEAWLIGSEGMTGVPVVLGDDDEPPLQRVVQVGGEACRLSRQDLRSAMEESKDLRRLLLRYVQLVLFQTAQEGACNANHDLKQRLSRWLMQARDGLGQDEIPLTHRTLGRLLGVRRASITDCLGVLEREGVVRARRGAIRTTDIDKLSALSCDCHRVIRREYCRLIGQTLPGG